MFAKSKDFYITLAITLILMLGFQFLPPFGQITPLGMKVLGIFLGVIFAWVRGEIIWSAMLGMFMLTAQGFGNATSNWSGLIGVQAAAMVIFGLLLVHGMKNSGLVEELAFAIVGSKWSKKGPWVLAAVFFIATDIVSFLIGGGLPVIILMWALFYEVCAKCELKAHTPFVSYVIVAIAIIGNSAMCTLPYSSTAVVGIGIAQGFAPTLTANYLTYFGLNILILIGYNILFLLVGRLVIGNDIPMKKLDESMTHKLNLTLSMKVALFYAILLAVMMFLPPFLPQGNALRVFLETTLSPLGVLIFIVMLMALTHIDGKPILDLVDGLRNGVQWPLVFLIGSAILIAGYLTGDGMGIIPTLTTLVDPILGGRSPLMILTFSIILCLIMTNLINDMVTMIVLFPICASFYVAVGGPVELMAYLFVPAMAQGMFMPSGSMNGALVHGNREWLTSGEAYKYLAIQEGCVIVVMTIASIVFGLLW